MTIPSVQGALGVPQPWARAAPEEPALGVQGVPQPWARAAPEEEPPEEKEPQPWEPGGGPGVARAVQPELWPGRNRKNDITVHCTKTTHISQQIDAQGCHGALTGAGGAGGGGMMPCGTTALGGAAFGGGAEGAAAAGALPPSYTASLNMLPKKPLSPFVSEMSFSLTVILGMVSITDWRAAGLGRTSNGPSSTRVAAGVPSAFIVTTTSQESW